MAKTGDPLMDLIYSHNEKIEALQAEVKELQEDLTNAHENHARMKEEHNNTFNALTHFLCEKYPDDLYQNGFPLPIVYWLENKRERERTDRQLQYKIHELRQLGYTVEKVAE